MKALRFERKLARYAAARVAGSVVAGAAALVVLVMAGSASSQWYLLQCCRG